MKEAKPEAKGPASAQQNTDKPFFDKEQKDAFTSDENFFSPSSATPTIQREEAPKADEPDDTSFSEGTFTISDPQAVIRDKDAGWAAIKYKKGDADLPTKKKDGEEVPDESYIGKDKLIPKGTSVTIDEVHIEDGATETSNDKLTHVHAVNFGWTSVGNVKGKLQNFSVGTMEATKPISTEPNHYTVAVNNAVILKSGNRYPKFDNNEAIPLNTEVEVLDTFKGYYGHNRKMYNVAKVSYGEKTTFTSSGNYSATPAKKEEPNKRKITDAAAYERQELASYIPDKGKAALALGKYVIIGDQFEKDTGTYVEVFEAAANEDTSINATYVKGDSLGFTNLLNLFPGFHTDLKGLNARWDQVIPDERYDRAKGKDTEGTAKFTGNDDMVKIVDSVGDVELISKEIWPSLSAMFSAAAADSHDLKLNTGYRDWDYQQRMVDGPWAANPAGFSSHQRGVAVDLNNKGDTSDGGKNEWMERNAYKFGFVRTYQKFKEGHHWEYRPSQVVKPKEVEIDGVKYMKYQFATYSSESTSLWDRSYVLDPIPANE